MIGQIKQTWKDKVFISIKTYQILLILKFASRHGDMFKKKLNFLKCMLTRHFSMLLSVKSCCNDFDIPYCLVLSYTCFSEYGQCICVFGPWIEELKNNVILWNTVSN